MPFWLVYYLRKWGCDLMVSFLLPFTAMDWFLIRILLLCSSLSFWSLGPQIYVYIRILWLVIFFLFLWSSTQFSFDVGILSIFGHLDSNHREMLSDNYHIVDKGYNSFPTKIPGTAYHKALLVRNVLSIIHPCMSIVAA
jgi:hypothetical protein